MGDEFPRRLCDPLPPVIILFCHVSLQPGGRGSQSLRGNSSPKSKATIIAIDAKSLNL